MKKTIAMLFSIITVFYLNPVFAHEPKNLDTVKASLIKYHDSGEYQNDQAKIIDKAMQYLKTRLESKKKSASEKKLAIVLDIDETSLSNYPDMLIQQFGVTSAEFDEAIEKAHDPVISATLELYRYAKANHVAVFFITGRPEKYRAATEKNLTDAGFQQWDGLTLKPNDYHEKSAAPYKTEARKAIENQGYDIVLNIGDQQSDLAGRHADKTFKLPNPYYLIP